MCFFSGSQQQCIKGGLKFKIIHQKKKANNQQVFNPLLAIYNASLLSNQVTKYHQQ